MSLDKKKGLSRRSFLAGASATLAAAIALTPGKEEREAAENAQRIKNLLEKATESRFATFLEPERKPNVYATGALAGKTFGNPLNDMLGLYGKTGGAAEIDFRYQLATLYQQKLKLLQGDEGDEFDLHNPGILEALQSLYESYSGQDTMIFEQYRQHVSAVVEKLRPGIPWQRIGKLYARGESQSRLLRLFAKQIDADLLVAYSMTELIPSENGNINAAIMDFLLQNAGRDYIERLPSLGDNAMSFGPYQFTGQALYSGLPGDAKKTTHENRGAAVIDGMMTTPVLPANIVSLQGDQHYQAAYLFAIYNVALLVNQMGEGLCAKIGAHAETISRAVPDYIPAAHNSPSEARSVFVRFVNETIGKRLTMNSNAPSYGQVLRPRLQGYVRKTQNNLAAVKNTNARKV